MSRVRWGGAPLIKACFYIQELEMCFIHQGARFKPMDESPIDCLPTLIQNFYDCAHGIFERMDAQRGRAYFSLLLKLKFDFVEEVDEN